MKKYGEKNAFTQNLFIINIVTVLFVAVFHLFIYSIPNFTQWILFGILIVTTGIPHGSLDYFVAKQSSKINSIQFSTFKFYFFYLTPMAIYAGLWLLFPTASLYFFLLLSAFHFGETDLELKTEAYFSSTTILQTIYGILILFIILFLNIKEVVPILEEIGLFSPSLLAFLNNPNAKFYAIGSVTTLLLFALIWNILKKEITVDLLKKIIISTTLVFVSSAILSLPLSFGIYFGLWHSIISLNKIKNHLSISTKAKISWKQLIMMCLPFTTLALFFIVAIVLMFNWQQHIDLLLMGVFIGISILTLPHQEVMSKMYNDIKKVSKTES